MKHGRDVGDALRAISDGLSSRPDSPEKLRALIEYAPVGIGLVDLDGRTVLGNGALRKMLGYSAEEFATLHFSEFTHPEDIEENLRLFALLAAGELDSFEMEKRFLHKDGQQIWAQLTVSLLRDESGRPEYAIGMAENITERKRLELQLKNAETKYRLLVEEAPAIVYLAEGGADGHWHYISPQIEALLGFSAEEWTADPNLWYSRIHPEDRLAALADEERLARSPEGERSTDHYRMVHKDGRIIWVRDDATVLHPANGEPTLFRGVLIDATREKLLEGELERQAFHDPLTGLANRVLLKERVEHCLARSMRQEHLTAAVLFIDLDDFKAVNDSLGHAFGDELIVSVASRIEGCIRAGDTAARLGGDEFAILLEDMDEPEDARKAAHRIKEAIESSPLTLQGRCVVATASIGIAIARPDDTSETLLRNADLAMYKAKARGKGQAAEYEPSMHDRALRNLDLQLSLETSASRGELSVVYQPILRLTSGEVVGVEALLRWTHPRLGPIPPAEFIPLAEENGSIVAIGAWVLEQACEEAARWSQTTREGSVPYVSVNLSPLQLLTTAIIGTVEMALERSGLAPDRLVLEVTEGVLIDERSREVLMVLRELGVRVAVDDFGTGYSSLAYLHKLPLDLLKIDRTFIELLTQGPEERALPKAIIKLAKALGFETIAEGVESSEQKAELEELGCSYAQGYLFSVPLPPEELGRAHEWAAATEPSLP